MIIEFIKDNDGIFKEAELVPDLTDKEKVEIDTVQLVGREFRNMRSGAECEVLWVMNEGSKSLPVTVGFRFKKTLNANCMPLEQFINNFRRVERC